MNELYEMIEKRKLKNPAIRGRFREAMFTMTSATRSREKRTVPMWYYRNLMMM